jgi:hypothetical protein
VAAWRRTFWVTRDLLYWSTATQAFIELAAANSAMALVGELKNFVYWLELLATHKDKVHPALRTKFISSFTLLAHNLGQQPNEQSVVQSLEHAIVMMRENNESPVEQYLAMASYYRSIANQSRNRARAIELAVREARHGSDDWARAMGALAWYYIDISWYKDSLGVVKELRSGFPGSLPPQLDCEASALTGIALFTSLRDLDRAKACLERAATYSKYLEGDPELAEWVQAAHQYLGRIAELNGAQNAALAFYLDTLRIQGFCREDITATGFAHLRIADLLTSNGLLAEAKDHLDEVDACFRLAANRGSARMQLRLGRARWQAAAGNESEAERIVLTAREEAAVIKFRRGELLCLGYLLALYVRRRRFQRLPWLTVRILGAAFNGELRRNLPLIVGRSLPIIRNTLRRIGSVPGVATDANRVVSCPCDLHGAEPVAFAEATR